MHWRDAEPHASSGGAALAGPLPAHSVDAPGSWADEECEHIQKRLNGVCRKP